MCCFLSHPSPSLWLIPTDCSGPHLDVLSSEESSLTPSPSLAWGPLPNIPVATRQHFLHDNTMHLVFEFAGYLCVYLFCTLSCVPATKERADLWKTVKQNKTNKSILMSKCYLP